MRLIWIILGTVFQLGLAMFLFVTVAFSSAGIANLSNLSKFHITILAASPFGLPLICISVAGIVIYLYTVNAGSVYYWLYLVPLILSIIYFAYATYLN